jgi:small redox-active disulfide protein 2
MKVKILGPGCKNCRSLEQRTRQALSDLALDADITDVSDYSEIARYGVMKTPGLVIDDEVVVSGRIPSPSELRDLIAARSRTAADSG